MKTLFHLLTKSWVLTLVMSSAIQISACAEETVFEVNFAGGFGFDVGLRALKAKGDGSPLPETRKPAFEEDLVAHSGVLGIKIGPGFPAVRYHVKDNLPEGQGAIFLQISGSEWLNDSGAWPLFQVGEEGAEAQWILEKKDGGLALTARDSSGRQLVLTVPVVSPNDNGDVDVQILYSTEAFWLLVNGREVGRIKWSGAPAWKGVMQVGDGKGAAGEAGAAVAVALKISPTAAEIPQDAEDEKELPAGKQYAGEPTKWWALQMPRLGLESLSPDYVPKPWTPVSWDAPVAGVWNRTYTLGEGGLVSQMTSAGRDLLQAPLSLQVLLGGKIQNLSFGAAEVVEQHSGKLKLRRVAQAPGCRVTATISMEYDGMVWVDLDVVADGDVERLTVEIPFRKEFSEYIHYIGAPYKYESQNLAWNSNSATLPRPGEILDLGFKTYVWIGNTEAGLQWFAESDESWWPLDRGNAIQIAREKDGSAVLRLNVIESPLSSDGSHFPLRFGLMATPVKPMPEGWRGWTITAQYGAPDSPQRGNNVIYWPDEWRAMALDPDPHRAIADKVPKVIEKVRQDHAAGRKILPYWTRIHLPISDGDVVNPDGAKMAGLWGADPDHVRGGKLNLRRVSIASGWSDYLVWCFDQWGEKFGHIDGLYLDETQPIPNRRSESNGGYITAAGERRATFEFLGSRDFIKRINYVGEKRHGGEMRTILHNSATYALPYMSHYSVFLPGEHMNSGYFQLSAPEVLPSEDERAKGYYYCHVLPMDRLIAEGYWQQWGVPIAWLPQLKNQKDIMNSPVAARDLLSRLQQVDALIWPLFMNRDEVTIMQKFRRDFGVGKSDVAFVPYWRNESITADQKDVVTGYYQRPGARLIIVSNLNTHPVTAKITFRDLVPDVVRLADTKKLFPAKDGEFEVTIPRNDYVALVTVDPASRQVSSTPEKTQP